MPYEFNNQGFDSGHPWVMLLVMIVFWTLLVLALLAVVRHWSHDHHLHPHPYLDHRDVTHREGPPSVGESPVDILKVRFAKGEIDEDEFARRLALLQGNK
jgi:putative membrane protein